MAYVPAVVRAQSSPLTTHSLQTLTINLPSENVTIMACITKVKIQMQKMREVKRAKADNSSGIHESTDSSGIGPKFL